MKKVFALICALAIFPLVGCVSSFKSIEEVPESKRPLYQATYDYMDCSMNSLDTLLKSGLTKETVPSEENMLLLADAACDACGEELAAYSQYVYAKTQMRDLADDEAQKLRKRTSEKLVEAMQEDSEKAE